MTPAQALPPPAARPAPLQQSLNVIPSVPSHLSLTCLVNDADLGTGQTCPTIRIQ